MNMVFPERITVTDQEIDCTHLSEARKEFITNFTLRLVADYKAHRDEGARRIYAVAGPSGSGKSYLSVLAEVLAAQIEPGIRIIPVSIDAYHFPNEYLSQTGSGPGTLKDVKGRYDTYDVPRLRHDLEEFKKGSTLRLPVYSRKLHEPIEGEIKVTEGPSVMLLEGLWLLYEGTGWKDLRALYDHSYFLDDDEVKLREQTILRHVRGGRVKEDAERQYDSHDAQNRALVLGTKSHADEELYWPK